MQIGSKCTLTKVKHIISNGMCNECNSKWDETLTEIKNTDILAL